VSKHHILALVPLCVFANHDAKVGGI
jgi:hypothetical protein